MIIHFKGGGGEVIGLQIRHVYADVIEGVPSRAINDQTVKWAVQRAEAEYRLPVHLVPPEQRPLGSPRPASRPEDEKVALPPFECVARVRGERVNRDADHAEACVVWYQATVATELPADVAARLSEVSWSDIAKDQYW